MKRLVGLVFCVAMLSAAGCLSARSTPRSYFVLNGQPREAVSVRPVVKGLVRVRNFDTDAVYEKFQIVVRRSPFQLSYSDRHVWAVKPNQMVADLVAQGLETSRVFSAVTRELVDVRPAYTLAGKLHAVEIYNSQDVWFAHFAASMYLTRFKDGERVWSMDFDQRKQVTTGDYGHAARALSELLQIMLTQGIGELSALEHADDRLWTPDDADAIDDPAVNVSPEVDPAAPVLIPESDRSLREDDP